MKIKIFKSIKSKIIFITVFLSMIFSIVICTVVYVNYRNLLTNHMIDVSSANLRLVMDSLDENMAQVKSVMEWATISSKLQNLLDYEEIDGKNGPEVINFIKVLSDMINNSLPDNMVEKVVIAGNTDVSMQAGSISGSPGDVEICRQSSWFQPLYEETDFIWTGIAANEFQYAASDYIIPLVRPVYNYGRHANVGFMMVGISNHILNDYIRQYSNYEDSQVMICNVQGQILAHSDTGMAGKRIDHYEQIITGINGRKEGHVQWKENNRVHLAVFYQSPVTNWYIVQILSDHEFMEQKQVIWRLLLFVLAGIVVMAVFLACGLSYFINRPIKRIVHKIEQISNADFSLSKEVETDDELGKIGIGINRMSENIVALMEKSVADEKHKKELELKVLQTQVNPHFLYNTLNSIKWMAVIQKASGIGEMATALSRLLRNMAKGVTSLISIKEELELAEDYITIQRFRYGESFRVEFEVSDELRQYLIPKFTLQPIIENAVFHGLEPKSGIGIIQVVMADLGKGIEIRIRDNGVGMTGEEIRQVMNGEGEKAKDSLNGIGIKNVDERIKLTFGVEYGLSIESVQGEFTLVTIRIPKVVLEGKHV